MGYVDFNLDEAYPFSWDGGRLEIPVYGCATIKYRSASDWWLDTLTLVASNGKYGDACVSWDETIKRGSVMFLIVEEYLQRQSEDVEAKIREDQRAEWESARFDEGKERAKLRGTGALI